MCNPPTNNCRRDSEPPDPAYTPDVIELGLRKLPAGLGGRGGENVVFKWPTGERFDGWAVDGVMAGRGTCAFEGGTRVIQLYLKLRVLEATPERNASTL